MDLTFEFMNEKYNGANNTHTDTQIAFKISIMNFVGSVGNLLVFDDWNNTTIELMHNVNE